jgi:ribonuclease BN (tRNA processing enzyme)
MNAEPHVVFKQSALTITAIAGHHRDAPSIIYTLHTPPHAIGEIAKKANVHKLLLSHLSPATEERHDTVLKSIQQNFTGPVSMATDGMRLQP